MIVYKQRILKGDVFVETPFVNSVVIGLSNGEIVRLEPVDVGPLRLRTIDVGPTDKFLND